MDFYTQVLIEIILALGAAMVVGNGMAIARRKRDRITAQESLKTNPRASKHTTATLVKNQVAQGKATLAVAPLWRSILYVVIGLVVFSWAAVTLIVA